MYIEAFNHFYTHELFRSIVDSSRSTVLPHTHTRTCDANRIFLFLLQLMEFYVCSAFSLFDSSNACERSKEARLLVRIAYGFIFDSRCTSAIGSAGEFYSHKNAMQINLAPDRQNDLIEIGTNGSFRLERSEPRVNFQSITFA